MFDPRRSLWMADYSHESTAGILKTVTPRKPHDPDATTLTDAASMLGLPEVTVTRLRREGLLRRLPGYPSYSRSDVREFIDNPWLNGRQAALVLGVSHNRVSQLAADGKIPVHRTHSGKRIYRLREIEAVAAARNLEFHDPVS